MIPLLVQGGEGAVGDILARLGCKREHPDTSVEVTRRFGADDARALSARAATRPVSAPHRTFVVVAADMTSEAQQALLKTLEEPPADAQFVLVVPSPEMLLPTVRSRMHILRIEQGEEASGAAGAQAFLAAPPSKRLELLKPLLESDKDEGRDLSGILAFLASLERALAARGAAQSREALAAVYRARRYASDKGALLKPLLEQVALLA